MKMTEILEKDKDRLLTEISAAGTAEKAIKILEKETDKILLSYNESAESDAERISAAHMMQAVRLSLPLIDSTGRTNVFEQEGSRKAKAKLPLSKILFTVVGLILLGFGIVPLILVVLSNADANSRNDILMRGLSVVMGAAALFMAGSQGQYKEIVNKKYHVELRVDADRIYRQFRTVILSLDQSLDEVRRGEKQAKREEAGNIDGRPATTPEIELFSDLLAASYSEDPEYALEKISEIKYYLHKQQIEVVDYSEDTVQYFDLMPGATAGTIRPALIADGRLLKKGLASKGN